MKKSYLLLSSNKSSGPYSLEQLQQLSLRPTDLFWIVNESVVWSNLSEIYELNELFENSGSNHVPSLLVTAISEPVTISSREVKKSSLHKVYVSLPAGTYKQVVEVTPSLEEKAEALKQKVLNFAAKKNQDTEISNSPSLPDLKAESNGLILPQKKKKNRPRLGIPLLYTTIVLLIAVSSFFLLRRQPQKETSNQPVELSLYKNSIPIAEPKKQKALLQDKDVVKPRVFPVNQTSENQEAQQKQTSAKTDTNGLTINKNTTAKNQITKIETITNYPQVEIKKATGQIENTPVINLIETSSQYFKNEDGIGLSITIQNKSEQSIRVAIIDVFYSDMANKQIGKETLYFGKIPPGTSSIKKSSPKEAASASYQVDLVSSEKSGLYVRKRVL